MRRGTPGHMPRPKIAPVSDVRSRIGDHAYRMTPADYVVDAVLVLLVLVQVREQPLTVRSLMRPVIVVGAAAVTYLHDIPTSENDLALATAFAEIGLLLGAASSATVHASGSVIAWRAENRARPGPPLWVIQ